MIPSRVSAITNTGSSKTTIIASEHVDAEAEVRLGLQDVVELAGVVAGQELERVRQDEEVAEREAADREDAGEQREPLDQLQPAPARRPGMKYAQTCQRMIGSATKTPK